jgi:hypothetical protein
MALLEVSIITALIGGVFAFLGLIFQSKFMQIIGGAILIYFFGVTKILPTWMMVVLVILFIYLLSKGSKT